MGAYIVWEMSRYGLRDLPGLIKKMKKRILNS